MLKTFFYTWRSTNIVELGQYFKRKNTDLFIKNLSSYVATLTFITEVLCIYVYPF